jgi:hypothetical protein
MTRIARLPRPMVALPGGHGLRAGTEVQPRVNEDELPRGQRARWWSWSSGAGTNRHEGSRESNNSAGSSDGERLGAPKGLAAQTQPGFTST